MGLYSFSTASCALNFYLIPVLSALWKFYSIPEWWEFSTIQAVTACPHIAEKVAGLRGLSSSDVEREVQEEEIKGKEENEEKKYVVNLRVLK